MSTTLGRADWVDEGDLLEGTITETADDLPTLILNLNDLGQVFILLIAQVKICIVLKVLASEGLAVELDTDFRISDSGQVIDSLGHERDNVVIKTLHAELCQVWPKANLCEIAAVCVLWDPGLVFARHIIVERLLEVLIATLVSCLNHELGRENVGEFGTKAVATARHLLVFVIVITRRQKLA